MANKEEKKAAGQKKRSTKHLEPYKFKPGQSGNPKGSSKKQREKTETRILMEELMDEYMSGPDGTKEKAISIILRRLRLMAMSGNLHAMREVLDRFDPKTQETKIMGDSDAPLQIEITSEDDNWKEKLRQRNADKQE